MRRGRFNASDGTGGGGGGMEGGGVVRTAQPTIIIKHLGPLAGRDEFAAADTSASSSNGHNNSNDHNSSNNSNNSLLGANGDTISFSPRRHSSALQYYSLTESDPRSYSGKDSSNLTPRNLQSSTTPDTSPTSPATKTIPAPAEGVLREAAARVAARVSTAPRNYNALGTMSSSNLEVLNFHSLNFVRPDFQVREAPANRYFKLRQKYLKAQQAEQQQQGGSGKTSPTAAIVPDKENSYTDDMAISSPEYQPRTSVSSSARSSISIPAPDIGDFGYGPVSADGMDVDQIPFKRTASFLNGLVQSPMPPSRTLPRLPSSAQTSTSSIPEIEMPPARLIDSGYDDQSRSKLPVPNKSTQSSISSLAAGLQSASNALHKIADGSQSSMVSADDEDYLEMSAKTHVVASPVRDGRKASAALSLLASHLSNNIPQQQQQPQRQQDQVERSASSKPVSALSIRLAGRSGSSSSALVPCLLPSPAPISSSLHVEASAARNRALSPLMGPSAPLVPVLQPVHHFSLENAGHPKSPSITSAPVTIPALGHATNSAFKNHATKSEEVDGSMASIASERDAQSEQSGPSSTDGSPRTSVVEVVTKEKERNGTSTGPVAFHRAFSAPTFAPMPPNSMASNYQRHIPTVDTRPSHAPGISRDRPLESGSSSVTSDEDNRDSTVGPLKSVKRGLQVNVKRKMSVDQGSPLASSVSYSSMSPSPAVSFLSSLVDLSVQKPPRGVYFEGDQIGDWILGREIGHGSFSRVFVASPADPTTDPPRKVAIKVVRKAYDDSASSSMTDLFGCTPSTNQNNQGSNGTMEDVQRILDHETAIWGKLHHPNVVEMVEVMDVDDAMFVVSEFCGGGNLLEFLTKNGPMPCGDARRLFREICGAVRYLHTEAGVVHRDIKCENVLLTERDGGGGVTAKLADFGLSDYITSSPPPSPASLVAADPIFCQGSLHYCAPEELRALTFKHPGSDVWSLGCVLYAMLTGSLPFNDGYLPRLQVMIVNGRYDQARLEKAGVGREVRELVAGMLRVRVEDRMTIEEVWSHPWVSEAGSV
ncbi:hypothetical protein HDU97_010256 [Phlyctochytrium planicorne]|nr:hypothetical protein HDU97_010256 [Phlyctochytrium planicorne]